MQLSYTISSLLALANIAVASSPTCLLLAVAKQPEPSNLDLVCTEYQNNMLGNITESCSSEADAQDAYDAYVSDCEKRNYTVASMSPFGSPTNTANPIATDSTASSATTLDAANASGSSAGSSATSSVSTAGVAGIVPSRSTIISALMGAGIAGFFL
ncbi:hypothetical protein CFIMG_002573RA [Ceratocystis fimbriata CBS 114723]|uniref:Uncharacterized protein n=1 Tax=Ceratocystis fimbriata CBS 114723 TaxID=1035309 RepID=A0A2C5X929_9PEZI|nr:hypothetical protein CFIMG_002573RA [Ceratocystis fimbriata CBS 114723]